MPQSKNRKNHKNKVNNFKQKTKKQMNQQNNQMLPEVQSVPMWAPDAKIELTGQEWELLINTLNHLQNAQQVTNAVMSRHIVNGTITMDFQKLDAEKMQYVEMTDAEKAPYREQINVAIEAIKNPEKAAEKLQKDAAYQAAVAEHENAPDPSQVSGSILAPDGKPAKKTKGKVVAMGN